VAEHDVGGVHRQEELRVPDHTRKTIRTIANRESTNVEGLARFLLEGLHLADRVWMNVVYSFMFELVPSGIPIPREL
jgi:hypothetical protein